MTAVKAVSFRRPRAAEALAEEQGGISISNGKILPTNELGARHSASFVLNDNFNYYQRYSKLEPIFYFKSNYKTNFYMHIHYFATTWGLENLKYEEQFKKIREAGYDGVETGRIKLSEIELVQELLEKYGLLLICQQWTEGATANDHIESFVEQAEINSKLNPLLINSHTGRDHFGLTKNLKILEGISRFQKQIKVPVTHETHRGRFGFAAHIMSDFLDSLPELKLTADFSHWCCVAESYLEDQKAAVEKAIKNSFHIHARIGNTQSSQVNDPQSGEWDEERELFLNWWKRIIDQNNTTEGIFPITCEFGPHPYMPTEPFTGNPLSSQWEANLFMKEFLKKGIIR